jgi:hypothetical protein
MDYDYYTEEDAQDAAEALIYVNNINDYLEVANIVLSLIGPRIWRRASGMDDYDIHDRIYTRAQKVARREAFRQAAEELDDEYRKETKRERRAGINAARQLMKKRVEETEE